MKRIVLSTAVVALITGITVVPPSAFGASNASANKIVISAVLENTSDPFWTTMGCGLKTEATRLGVTLKTFFSTTISTSTASSNFSAAQLVHPAGEFLAPFDTNQFAVQQAALMKKGVPVVDDATTSPPAQLQVVFTSPALTYLPQLLKVIGKPTGTSVLLGGAPGIPPLEARVNPLVAALKKNVPSLTQLPVVYDGFNISTATSDVSSLLLAHPDLKLIIASSGPEGQAAAAAVQQAGKAGKVKIVAFDAVPAEVAAVKSGTIQALIAQSPIQIGEQAISSLVSYLIARPTNGSVTKRLAPDLFPQLLVTKSNVNNTTVKSLYEYRASC
jgi:ribose transport system substrate-binding protein